MRVRKNSLWSAGLTLAIALLSVIPASARLPAADDFLYYRRTHDGAWPPPGVNPSDHSGETTNLTTEVAPRIGGPVMKRSANTLDNGVDPANLGKGDWLWQLPTCENQLGGYVSSVTNLQSLIQWETNHGMQWITVKCGDGGSIWSQFDANLVATAHKAGLKIFGWGYAYGNDVQGEINVALNALNLGADGFIIDAEIEYETTAGTVSQGHLIRQHDQGRLSERFLAHAPFPIISSHSGFPLRRIRQIL